MRFASVRPRWILICALAVGLGFMTAVSIQQSRTIDAQDLLIHQLSKDSLRLSALRLQEQEASRHRP